jgi:SAM-dependent methyltransferase
LYRYGWDTRCRNREALKLIGEALDEDGLLDVGCGPGGVATFLPKVQVTGVDLSQPTSPPPNLRFVLGSITDLPFEDRAFGVVACVDTIEHLSPDERTAGIAELVRVADRDLIITCPNGDVARRSDDDFRGLLEAEDRPLPPWVIEHQSHPYPTLDEVVRDIGTARNPRITAHFSESTRVRTLLNAAAARSNAFWAVSNLAAGLLLPVVPKPKEARSYRFVLRAQLG